ncbi:MAG: thioredoxin-dependent peroxiredoxin [Clostridium butyricum]|nr:thioredoxin-dependent peroxiredoxin [Clostridium butyricum]
MKYLNFGIGDKIPEFSLKDSEGHQINSRDFIGNWLVLYFYPRDNTPGCTKEAVDFSQLVIKLASLIYKFLCDYIIIL